MVSDLYKDERTTSRTAYTPGPPLCINDLGISEYLGINVTTGLRFVGFNGSFSVSRQNKQKYRFGHRDEVVFTFTGADTVMHIHWR